MDVVGALGFPAARPNPILQQPRPQSRIGEGLLETILVEVTPVGTVARPLEAAWQVMKLRPEPGARYAAYVTYDHPRGYFAVIQSIEALQESFLP